MLRKCNWSLLLIERLLDNLHYSAKDLTESLSNVIEEEFMIGVFKQFEIKMPRGAGETTLSSTG